MKLHYKMSKQEWKELLDYLNTSPNIHLVHYAETDNDGYFVDFCYATIEYNGNYYYLEDGRTNLTDFTVCRFLKISPYEKQQNAYPRYIYSTEELVEYMKSSRQAIPLSQTYMQRIYLTHIYGITNGHTALWHLRYELAGNREKAILENLEHITMVRHTKDYCVLRFHSANGDWFDYETKSKRITG